MSLLQQFPGRGDAPPVPPPPAPASAAILSGRQPVAQIGVPTPTELPWFSQGQPFVQPWLADPGTGCFGWLLKHLLEKQVRIVDIPKPLERARKSPYTPGNAPYLETDQDFASRPVEQAFVLEDRSAVPAFIKRNGLLRLLLQAHEPLTSAFGEATVKKLTLVEADEGFTTLFCLVLISGSLDEAKRALNRFDESWWLAHSPEAADRLNFDFELI